MWVFAGIDKEVHVFTLSVSGVGRVGSIPLSGLSLIDVPGPLHLTGSVQFGYYDVVVMVMLGNLRSTSGDILALGDEILLSTENNILVRGNVYIFKYQILKYRIHFATEFIDHELFRKRVIFFAFDA